MSSLDQELINHTEAFCKGVPLTAKELKAERSKRYYEANKGKYATWRENNREKVREYNKKSREKAKQKTKKTPKGKTERENNPPVMARCKHCFKLVPDGKCNCREAKCDR